MCVCLSVVNWSFCQFQGSPRLPRVTQGLPKVTQIYQRLPKVACISMRLKAFNELAWSSKSRNAAPWPCLQFHEFACSYISLHAVERDACSYMSMHAVPWAYMKYQELACSFMSLYAVSFFVWAAHKNFAVLVLEEIQMPKALDKSGLDPPTLNKYNNFEAWLFCDMTGPKILPPLHRLTFITKQYFLGRVH